MIDPIAYISADDIPSPLGNAITREIEQVAPTDYSLESNSGPVLTTFATLQNEPAVNDHLEAAVANDLFALVMPPINEGGRSTTVSTIEDTELTLRHSETESIHVGQEIFSDIPERELSVSTIGYFDSFSGRVLGRDQNDEPVLIELRETSTAGGVLFTTVALNELAVSGNEQHRRDLVAALIAYLDDAIEDAKQVEKSGSIDESTAEESKPERSTPPKKYDAGLLTLYYYVHTDEAVELTRGLPEEVLPAGLSTEFTDKEWNQFIAAAEQDGLISDSGLQPNAVSAAVDERNLRSFARRLDL